MTRSASFAKDIQALLPGLPLRENEPMAEHTSFRIGGPAECMAFPGTQQELALLLRFARERELDCLLLGGGSNLLAPDEGLPGLVIQTRSRMTALTCSGGQIRAQSGVPLSRLAAFAAEQGLQGLEFAHGIPGTVGGGVYMNAGAYGGELAQLVQSTRALTPEGEVCTLTGAEHGFAYRQSVFMHRPLCITETCFTLEPGEPAQIRARMEELARRRREKQPLDKPSAGSAFKRPQGGYAAALIDEAGLKGLRVGGAAVSEKHAGFIVNLGGATADDVRRLIAELQRRVFAASGVSLEPEIRIL